MASTYSDRLKLELMESGANANTWGTRTNNNLNVIEAFGSGYISKSVAGSADVTLTTANSDPSTESANKVIELTGTLTGNIKVLIPAVENNYIFFNNTAGSHTLTVAPTGHTSNGVVVTQGSHTILYCVGNKVVDIFANSLGTLSAKTSLTVSGTVITAANGDINAASYSGSGSGLSGVSSIPSGTTALFFQASAPTGWTQNTATSINECCLRVVTGSGGGTGGADTFTTSLAPSKTTESKTVPFTVNNPGTVGDGSTPSGDTTLSVPTIASHSHPSMGVYSTQARFPRPNPPEGFPDSHPVPGPGTTSGSTGGGGAHNHPFPAQPFTAGPASVSSAAAALSIPTMDVKFEDVIACEKD